MDESAPDAATELAELLRGLRPADELHQLTIKKLRDYASAAGVRISDLKRKPDLVEVLSSPDSVALRIADAELDWQVVSPDRLVDAILWRGHLLKVDIDGTNVHVTTIPRGSTRSLAETLRSVGADVEFVERGARPMDEILDLLDETVPMAGGQIELGDDLAVAHEVDGSCRWFAERVGLEEGEVVAVAQWDFLGPGMPSPGSDAPGSVRVTETRGVLIGRDFAAERTWSRAAPTGSLTGSGLAEVLGDFYEHLVNRQTYSLSLPEHFTDGDVGSFLRTASSIGVLKINGQWWYESPDGWKTQRLKPMAWEPLDTDSLEGIAIEWLQPGFESEPVVVVLLSDEEWNVRGPLAVLAGHKSNGWSRSQVGIAFTHLGSGENRAGVALLEDESVMELIGAQPHFRVLPSEERVWALATAGGAWAEVEVPLVEDSSSTPDPFFAAIDWLREARQGKFFKSRRHSQDEHSLKATTPAPLSASQPFKMVRNLEAGEKRYLMLGAVGRDDDGSVWLDPSARARMVGSAENEPVVECSAGGSIVVQLGALKRGVGQREPRHSLAVEVAEG